MRADSCRYQAADREGAYGLFREMQATLAEMAKGIGTVPPGPPVSGYI